jgi:hypothetical protein
MLERVPFRFLVALALFASPLPLRADLVIDAPTSVVATDPGAVCFRFTVTNTGAEPVNIPENVQVLNVDNINGYQTSVEFVDPGETETVTYSGQLVIPDENGAVRIVYDVQSYDVAVEHALIVAAPFGWTISASSVDPYDNATEATSTLRTLYLWYACCRYPIPGGMTAVEFGLESVGLVHLSTNPVNGFLNAGSTTYILMAVGGCPCGPIVAAELMVIDNPGTMTIIPSIETGNKGGVNCGNHPVLLPIDWIGYDNVGEFPCFKGEVDCGPISVESASWGKIKSLYR